MTIQEIIKKVRSGVFKLEFYSSGKLINSGSGFICNGKLITNNHVWNPKGIVFQNDTPIKIIFGDGSSFNLIKVDFTLENGSSEDDFDYAILKTEKFSYADRYSFELSGIDTIQEGDDVVLFGYPFDTTNFSSHAGKISAIYASAKTGLNIIQIDASVNNGNSGGPLFHIQTEKVIGVVTRKQTGLYKNFEDLINSLHENAKFLQSTKAIMSVGGIDPIKGLGLIETQMIQVAENLKRSSNTGIGYAFTCEKIISNF